MLAASLEGFYQFDQAVGKQSVCKKRVVCSFHKQFAAIVVGIIDGFGVIGVFINAFPDIGFHHIVKHLKNTARHNFRMGNQFVEKLLKGNRAALFLCAHVLVEIEHGFLNAVLGAGLFFGGLFLLFQSADGFFYFAHEASPVLACCRFVNVRVC